VLPISVIIPCYNAASTLVRALDSCIVQPEAAQIIVVDDRSSDGSRAITARYAKKDARVELLKMPENGGPALARNWAAMHARFPTLAFLDADDEYYPDALAAAGHYLTENPKEAAVRLDVEFVGFSTEITSHPDFEIWRQTLSNTVPSSLIIRQVAFSIIGGFPTWPIYRSGGEDAPVSFSLAELFGQRRIDDKKRVRMHYHRGIHAEKFFMIMMGKRQADNEHTKNVCDADFRFLDSVRTNLRQSREFNVKL
jgi:glycosyltransferase involved in cell wall biosynthesis